MKPDFSAEYDRQFWFPFQNNSEEDIPACAILKIDGRDEVHGEQYLIAKKPTTFGSQYAHYVNSGVPVPEGKYGQCAILGPLHALYETSDGTPAVGESWGPRSGTWKLRKNTGGFRVLGVTNSSLGIVLVTQEPFLAFLGTSAAAISQSASGNVTVVSGVTLSVYAAFGDIEDASLVWCQWDILNARWTAIQVPCPA